MKTLRGETVNQGQVLSVVKKINEVDVEVISGTKGTVSEELQKFHRALTMSKAEIQKLFDIAYEKYGEDIAIIFQAHLLMIEDKYLNNIVVKHIKEDNMSAIDAYKAARDDVIAKFDDLDNNYIKKRIIDIEDITFRVICHLKGISSLPKANFEEKVIILLKKIKPSNVIEFDKGNIIGFITENGSYETHSSIIAREMNLPGIIIHGVFDEIESGDVVILDANEGVVYVNPDKKLAMKYLS